MGYVCPEGILSSCYWDIYRSIIRQLLVPFLGRQLAHTFTLLFDSLFYAAVWNVKATILLLEEAALTLRMSFKETELLKILWQRYSCQEGALEILRTSVAH